MTETTPQGVYPEWVVTESEKKLHDDFRAFMWLVWKHLRLPKPTRRQLAIAKYLQNGPRRRMVQAFRGVGKSWITAAYVLWRLYRNPQEHILVVSANENKATEFCTFTRRLIGEIEQLHFLLPKKDQRDSVLAFDVGPAMASQSPSVRAAGISGQITGGRATVIVSDDVEVPKNSFTETMREKLAEQVKEYDAVLSPGGEIIYLGTPQTEQSIYNIVRKRGYDCKIWPARYPSPDQVLKYNGALAEDIVGDLTIGPRLAGTSTDPERFTDLDLAEREASYGRSGFQLQFQLDTTLSDAERYPLKLADLMVLDVDTWTDKYGKRIGPVSLQWASGPLQVLSGYANPGFSGDRFHRPMFISDERQAWQGTVMVIDGSGRGGDETAYAVVRQLYGTLYLVASGGFKDGYSDTTLAGLVAIAKEKQVNHVLVEANYGDGMFTKLLEPHFIREYPCTIEEYKVTGQKEIRIIEDLEPIMNQHKLVIDETVIEADLAVEEPKYSLFYQLTHITKDRGSLRHDDRLESLARACRYFRDQLAMDSARAEAEHRAAQQQEQLDAFMARCKRPTQQQTYQRVASVLRR